MLSLTSLSDSAGISQDDESETTKPSAWRCGLRFEFRIRRFHTGPSRLSGPQAQMW